MHRKGRPCTHWHDWEGREGTVYEMCAWHNATRAALYQRATRMAKGVWYLNAPKRPRTDRTKAA